MLESDRAGPHNYRVINFHRIASQLSLIVRRFAAAVRVDVTFFLRSDVDCDSVDSLCIYLLAPRLESWKLPLVSTEFGWRLNGNESRLDSPLIPTAVRDALKRGPDVRHVLMSFPEYEFVAQRVAEELQLSHAHADGER